MKESAKQAFIVWGFLVLGCLFLLLGLEGVPYFVFWELAFGIGGIIAIYQTEKKEAERNKP